MAVLARRTSRQASWKRPKNRCPSLSPPPAGRSRRKVATVPAAMSRRKSTNCPATTPRVTRGERSTSVHGSPCGGVASTRANAAITSRCIERFQLPPPPARGPGVGPAGLPPEHGRGDSMGHTAACQATSTALPDRLSAWQRPRFGSGRVPRLCEPCAGVGNASENTRLTARPTGRNPVCHGCVSRGIRRCEGRAQGGTAHRAVAHRKFRVRHKLGTPPERSSACRKLRFPLSDP